jgi:hypothetical protein
MLLIVKVERAVPTMEAAVVRFRDKELLSRSDAHSILGLLRPKRVR